MPPASEASGEIRGAVRRCGRDKAFLAALAGIYRELDAATGQAGGDCRACGRCCRFDRMDHRLYASVGEIAYLLLRERPAGGAGGQGRCPYQVEPYCMAREHRPLGCRSYFCRPPEAVEAGREAYERFHRRVRALHGGHGLPYGYVELTGALRLLEDG
jgi:Fe-S-cluster containining protein